MKTAIVCISVQGARTGRNLLEKLKDTSMFLPEHIIVHGYDSENIIRFRKPVSSILENLMREFDRIIFIMATGIVVRLIAPFLVNKRVDPAVVVLDEKGTHVISLLSGHLGGANALARKIAFFTGGTPVITTASDVQKKPAIDLLAKESGCVIENPERVPAFMRAFLDGEPVGFFDPEKRLALSFREYENVTFFDSFEEAMNMGAMEIALLSNRTFITERENRLLLRPKNIIAGVGCRRGVSCKEIEEAFLLGCACAEVSPLSLMSVATVDLKMDEEGLLEFAKKYGVPVNFFSTDEIRAESGNEKREGRVGDLIGVSGVCEPCAALAGGRGRLLLEKMKHRKRVTIALAEAK